MSLRHWVDHDGMGCGSWRLPPDLDALVMARIEQETGAIFREARRVGRRDRADRYAAEALVAVVTGTAASRPVGPGVVVLVDLPALAHGNVEGDEVCLVPGYGDVPVGVARRLLDDNAFVIGVLRDGTNVLAVKGFGRRFPTAVRTALTVESVLRDGELRCAHPGCDRRIVTWDHVVGVAQGGASVKENGQPLCFEHNNDKGIRDNHPSAARARSGSRRRPATRRRAARRGSRGPDPP
jgi:hypothetical protein